MRKLADGRQAFRRCTSQSGGQGAAVFLLGEGMPQRFAGALGTGINSAHLLLQKLSCGYLFFVPAGLSLVGDLAHQPTIDKVIAIFIGSVDMNTAAQLFAAAAAGENPAESRCREIASTQLDNLALVTGSAHHQAIGFTLTRRQFEPILQNSGYCFLASVVAAQLGFLQSVGVMAAALAGKGLGL